MMRLTLSAKELLLLAICLGVMLLSAFSGPVALLAGAVVASIGVWSANPRYVVILIVLSSTSSDFGALSLSGGDSNTLTTGFGGISLTIPYVVNLVMTSRVIYEWLTDSAVFRDRLSRILLILWLAAHPIALYETYLGFMDGSPSWTVAIRALWTVGAFFYGVALWRRGSGRVDFVFSQLFVISALCMTAAVTGYYYSRLTSFCVALVPGMAMYCVIRGVLAMKLAAIVALLPTAMFAFGFGHTALDFGGGLMGDGRANFSLNLTFGGSLLVGLWVIFFETSNSRWITVFSLVGGLSGLVVPAVIGSGWDPFRSQSGTSFSLQSSTSDRLENKILADRGIIWSATVSAIQSEEKWLKPPGRILYLDDSRGGDARPFLGGAHNYYLEALRQLGLGLGSVLCILHIVITGVGGWLLAHGASREDRLLGGLTAAHGLIASPVGAYLLAEGVAIWHFALVGFLYVRSRFRLSPEGTSARPFEAAFASRVSP